MPRLITGAEPPKPELPARYEIGVGHEDERRAFSAGSTTSAGERHKQRLRAASVRADLAGLIGHLDGSPGGQQIATWLAQLNDEEVLDRMSRLQPTHTYDADTVLRNFSVLQGLRDEAVSFCHNQPSEM